MEEWSGFNNKHLRIDFKGSSVKKGIVLRINCYALTEYENQNLGEFPLEDNRNKKFIDLSFVDENNINNGTDSRRFPPDRRE